MIFLVLLSPAIVCSHFDTVTAVLVYFCRPVVGDYIINRVSAVVGSMCFVGAGLIEVLHNEYVTDLW